MKKMGQMMGSAVFAIGVAVIPALALAETPPAPAPAPAQPAKGYTTAETTIGTLLEDSAAKAIIEKHFPGFTTSESIQMASSMTFRQIQPFKPDMFTDEVLAQIDAELAKLPAK